MRIIPTAVVSAAEFERARGVIPGLMDYVSYGHWLDSRYGRLMGLSLGGVDAELKSVALDEFLDWCRALWIGPSEIALDAFALAPLGRLDFAQDA